MTSINDVLKASKGSHVDDIFAQLWGRKLSGGYTIATYTGTLPAVLTGTKAGYLHGYKIYGNTEQTGTPTPENPIVPSECGELETTGVHAGQYKLPLSSSGQSVDIYLGESQTTRRIKKLVLTGEEDYTWYKSPTRNYSWYLHPNTIGTIMNTPFYCSHGETVTNVSDYGYGKVYCDNTCNLGIFDSSIDTTTKLKNYFAQQYANGTPVIIWYVLATEETDALNEPLRKIGNYADTIDSTQTSVQIPTSAGSTTISWAGSGLAPSQVELTYEKE